MDNQPSRSLALLLGAALCSAAAPETVALSITVDLHSYAVTDVASDASPRLIDTAAGPITAGLHDLAGIPGTTPAYAEHTSAVAANAGSVALFSRAAVAGPFVGSFSPQKELNAGGDAGAQIHIDDVVFSGPGPTVTASLMLDVNGTLGGSATALTSGAIALGGGTFVLGARLAGPIVTSGQRTYSAQHVGGGIATSGIAIDTAPFTGVVFPDTLTFAPVTLLTNHPYELNLAAFVSSGAQVRRSGPANGSADGSALFGATVSFPTAGPVFVLPPGFTANSVSAQIANNAWLGTPMSLVPLPLAALLFASGLVVLIPRT